MSEEKCPKCNSSFFIIVRDMTSRRICCRGHIWYPVDNKIEVLQKENERLKKELEVSEAANISLAEENEKLKKLLTKELSENDEFCMEYTGIVLLKQDIKKLKKITESANMIAGELLDENIRLKKQLEVAVIYLKECNPNFEPRAASTLKRIEAIK